MVAIIKGEDGHFIWQKFLHKKSCKIFLEAEINVYKNVYQKEPENFILKNIDAYKLFPEVPKKRITERRLGINFRKLLEEKLLFQNKQN